MHTFADSQGRSWPLVIHVAAIKRVRGMIGVDIYGLVDNSFENLSKLLGDPVQFVDTLYVLCKDDCDRLGLSDEDFGRAMFGDTLHRAAEAFMEELTDFFPNPRIREAIRKLTEAGKHMTTQVMDHVMAELDYKISEMDVTAVVKSLKESYGNSRDASASTPAHSHSANSA